ncbi:NUDIX domain-containing protein, partial [Streptomyces sp. Tu 6176]|uniref:NUDIX domain-containing protein n=1 Tax=Streptomyces sp. Tu 6176 TaxID=1470557 RepID=UPI001F3EF247
MTSEQTPRGAVHAVVVHDGRLLLVDERGGWRLPSGTPEPAESSRATAARVVHETTGYLVDGSSELDADAGAGGGEAAPEAVVCQLLTADPSSGPGSRRSRSAGCRWRRRRTARCPARYATTWRVTRPYDGR